MSPEPFDPSAERSLIAETLLRSAATLIDGRSDREVVGGVCEALTRVAPRIRLAWTWFGPTDTTLIAPQVFAGVASAYAAELVVARNPLTRLGPAYRALDGAAPAPFGVSARSLFGPWRRAAREHGVKTALALSLPSGLPGRGGIFVLYADSEHYFDRVGVSLFEALADLFGSVLTLAGERRELERAAYHDALTGLLTRSAMPLIERRVQRAAGAGAGTAVLVIDLDHFKRVNDGHGHAVGDALLCACAHALQSIVRRGDFAVRWGGEEFVVLLLDTGAADARGVAQSLRERVAAIETPVRATCSIGLARLRPGEGLAQAIGRADEALYAAKAAGRNRVEERVEP